MKKILLSLLCVLAFTGSSFAGNITLSGEGPAVKHIKKTMLSYYDNSAWTNSGIGYRAHAVIYNHTSNMVTIGQNDGSGNDWAELFTGCTPFPDGSDVNSDGTITCPDKEFAIIKVASGCLFRCVSVEDLLNYVNDGTYPVTNK